MMTRLQRSQDTMYSLAADTGGKALFDVNMTTLAGHRERAGRRITATTSSAITRTNANLDGKFRRINISLKEITANLDYRKGYFANKVFGKFTTADKERQLEDALMMGDPITDLTIQMEVNYFQLNRAEYYVPLMMKIPGRSASWRWPAVAAPNAP